MLRDKLDSLPESLDGMYAQILTGLMKEYIRHAIRILQFPTFSERPLTVREAVDAIAVASDENTRFDSKSRLADIREITKICSSLVSLVNTRDDDEESGELKLAHFSVKQYLGVLSTKASVRSLA